MTIAEAVTKRIFELCAQRNITLNKMSIICGMTQSTLNNIVNSGSNDPKLSTIKKICDGMDISFKEFFDTEYFDALEQEIR